MEEIGATIYQAVVSFMVPFVCPRPINHPFLPDFPITQELVPSLFEDQ